MSHKQVVLQGDLCVLKPYGREFVDIYHKWMSDPAIQELTQTEPAFCTHEAVQETLDRLGEDQTVLAFIIHTKDHVPVGDIAVFAHPWLEDPPAVEIDIMIAEEDYRRRGLAKAAIKLLAAYLGILKKGSEGPFANIEQILAKIIKKNEPSLKLFEKLGFQHQEFDDTFQQYCLSKTIEHDEDVEIVIEPLDGNAEAKEE